MSVLAPFPCCLLLTVKLIDIPESWKCPLNSSYFQSYLEAIHLKTVATGRTWWSCQLLKTRSRTGCWVCSFRHAHQTITLIRFVTLNVILDNCQYPHFSHLWKTTLPHISYLAHDAIKAELMKAHQITVPDNLRIVTQQHRTILHSLDISIAEFLG